MTDLNVTITDVDLGEVVDKFSVHKGGSLSMNSLTATIRDAIRSERDIDHFVHQPKKRHVISWETISPFVARLAVDGGWIYQGADKQWVYVPDPNWISSIEVDKI